jgi:RelA/SpoT family (p)ppGpp synthetase
LPLDDVSIASALLHDVIEDCEEYSFDDLQELFGQTVAEIVDGATKISNVLKSREVSKAESYRKLLLSMIKDIRVILIKFADRLHNMRTLEFVSEEKQIRISRETMEIYAPLAHRFGLGRIKWELEDYAFKYLHPIEFKQLTDLVSAKRREREEYLARFEKPIIASLKKSGLKFEISGRPKHLYSIYKKMQDRIKTFDEIYDLLAIRIILESQDARDCFYAYAIVCEIYTPIPERYKNYIALPKKNGYKSIHTSVVGIDGKMVEVQIRTRDMHEIAEKGIAAHWAYKEGGKTRQNDFDEWIRQVREMLEFMQAVPSDEDQAKVLIESFKNNLYEEEIVVFTPKGELMVLPKDSTPVDFAFEIHSEIGLHCIGAKVNGRIVPLNSKLRSGDRIEIITSRNQFISPDWQHNVITNKAKSAIKKWENEHYKDVVVKGRERWAKRQKKTKETYREQHLQRAAAVLRFDGLSELFHALGEDEITTDQIVEAIEGSRSEPVIAANGPSIAEQFERYTTDIRNAQILLIDGKASQMQYEYARCCNPLPGDDIVGFVTLGGGLKVHRKDCPNIQRLAQDKDGNASPMKDRIIEMSWPSGTDREYLSSIKLHGNDRPGALNEITSVILSYNKTNIKGVDIQVDDSTSTFYGSLLVSVRNLGHLQELIDRLTQIKGVTSIERHAG